MMDTATINQLENMRDDAETLMNTAMKYSRSRNERTEI